MGSISNGRPQGVTLGPIEVPGSVRDAEDEIASFGYDGIELSASGDGRVIATTYNARGQRVQAIGKGQTAAAQALVRSVTGTYRR
jgi:hypothetical protein